MIRDLQNNIGNIIHAQEAVVDHAEQDHQGHQARQYAAVLLGGFCQFPWPVERRMALGGQHFIAHYFTPVAAVMTWVCVSPAVAKTSAICLARITTSRSLSAMTSGSSEEIKIMAVPCAASWRMTL